MVTNSLIHRQLLTDHCDSVRCGLWFQRVEEVIDIERTPILTPLNMNKDVADSYDHRNKRRKMQNKESHDEDEDMRLYKRIRILQKKYSDMSKSTEESSREERGIEARKSKNSAAARQLTPNREFSISDHRSSSQRDPNRRKHPSRVRNGNQLNRLSSRQLTQSFPHNNHGGSVDDTAKGVGPAQKDCANCHVKTTPEWRLGPSGKRDLCNSCGLRWLKQVSQEIYDTIRLSRTERLILVKRILRQTVIPMARPLPFFPP